ncbi:MAG: excalibur calcium-binding domain-containing protein [Caldilineaceae bacterium]|nr:excalibur calcium-binding domain-containing protein [Caldilineaceae bacterium]
MSGKISREGVRKSARIAPSLWIIGGRNGDGRITCAEARSHDMAFVCSGHPAYAYIWDGDGVVCE